MPRFILIIFLLTIYTQINISGQSKVKVNKLFREGISALARNRVDSAEAYFQKSIEENSDPGSYYELAKIYKEKNTVGSRIRARDFIEKAILKEPENIKYKFLMAELAEKISGDLAAHYYKKIIEIDSTNSAALYNLGRIEEQNYDEYHNSFTKEKDDIELSHKKFADKFFKESEILLKKAIQYDSLNRNAYLHLGFLYEDAGKPEKGIKRLKHLLKINDNNEQAHLYLGLLYYETSKIKESFEEYQKALVLMNKNERQNFVYNSVKELLEPVLGKEFKDASPLKIKRIIDYFWKYSDPLYLTDYNERLLEHYSRVAYANLRFGLKYKKEPGWKTDRGEMILRYGWPNKRVRYRPQMSGDEGGVISMKTDVWYYDNFVLGFTDQFMSGNFVFSEPDEGKRYASQFPGETNLYINYIRRAEFTAYKPKFEGPSFKIPFKIAEFKNLQKGNYNFTDVYVNYGMNMRDSLNNISLPYEWGLFFFDLNLNPVHRDKGFMSRIDSADIIGIPGQDYIYTSSKMMTLWPDSGELAFEIIRKKDHGVSSNHLLFGVKKFNLKTPDISDILLAYNIKENDSLSSPVKRRNYSIYPNPTGIFSPRIPLYIYYEVYNLKTDSSGFSNFEQSLTITKKETHSQVADAVNSVISIFGLGRHDKKVIITTGYRTLGKNPGIYFQLDMSPYPPGKYELKINIKDKLTGAETGAKTEVIWK